MSHFSLKISKRVGFKKKYSLLFLFSLLLIGVSSTIYFFVFNKPVASADTHAQDIINSCVSQGNAENCYSSLLAQVTTEKGADYAVKLLSEIQKIEPSTRGCHFIAHGIATAEAEKDLSKWKEVLGRLPTALCSGGYIHGVIEAKQVSDSSFAITSETIPQFCATVPNVEMGNSMAKCIHIMGHLSMVETKGDLAKARQICEGVSREEDRYECLSGAFMENETRENLVSHGLAKRIPWNEETTAAQEKLCQEATGLASKACWREIAHMYSFISNRYPPKTLEYCSRAPTPNDVDTCYRYTLGIMIVSSKFNEENLKYLCQPYIKNVSLYTNCYGILIGSLITSTPQLTDRAIKLCNVIPVGLAQDCFSVIGKRLEPITTKKDREELCSPIQDMYRGLCLGTS